MASRKSIEDATQEVVKYFNLLSKKIQSVIVTSVFNQRNASVVDISQTIERLIQNTESKVYPIIKKDLEWHYMSGAVEVTKAMREAGIAIKDVLSEQQVLEMNAVISSSLNDFGNSLRGAFYSAQKVITDVRKVRFQEYFLEAKSGKYTMKEIKDKIVKDIAKDFTSIVDKSGREWKLDVYAEMLARTRLREVTNLGLKTRMMLEGYDLVQISSHGGGCDLCQPWDGKILSLTGKTSGYPTLDDAYNDGMFHPNCRHRLLPYHIEFDNNDMGIA